MSTTWIVIAFAAAVAVVGGSAAFVWIASRGRRVVTRADIERVAPRIPSEHFARELQDASFDADAFLEVAGALFEAFHRGIESGDLDGLKPFLTEDLYAKHVDAVTARHRRKQRAVMKNFKTHRLAIRSAVTVRSWNSITMRALASCADYEVDANGKVYGDKKVRAWEEDWLFERSFDQNSKLRDTWTVTGITAVDRNRFRAGERIARDERNDNFWAGRSTKANRII